jgi:hypothetical protein
VHWNGNPNLLLALLPCSPAPCFPERETEAETETEIGKEKEKERGEQVYIPWIDYMCTSDASQPNEQKNKTLFWHHVRVFHCNP